MAKSVCFDPETFSEPVYFCQALVLVRRMDGDPEFFEFIEDAPAFGFEVGDRMPADWATAPANHAARELYLSELNAN